MTVSDPRFDILCILYIQAYKTTRSYHRGYQSMSKNNFARALSAGRSGDTNGMAPDWLYIAAMGRVRKNGRGEKLK